MNENQTNIKEMKMKKQSINENEWCIKQTNIKK